MKHVVVTGGGTAGHVVPALPIIDALRDEGVRVTFVGSTTGLEERLLGDRDVPYVGISSGKLRRYLSWENLTDVFRVLAGIVQAFVHLGRLRPDAVFSKGGFVSFPVVFAAWLRGIPAVAHESDITPGLANRLAMPFVRALCTNFPQEGERETTETPRRRWTGTPVRRALLEGDPEAGRQWLGAPADQPTLVVTGGSLGSERINRAVADALPRLLEDWFVVHVTGAGKQVVEDPPPGYRALEFVDREWGNVLAAADVVVSRAGANTLYELMVLRKPNVLIPLPLAQSRGDQLENASFATARGYSLRIDEDELTPDRLIDATRQLRDERADWIERLAQFEPPDTVPAIVGLLHEAASSRSR